MEQSNQVDGLAPAEDGPVATLPGPSALKERPILFSAPMVRAILKGWKTQTRRQAKFVPVDWGNWSQEARDSFYRHRCPYGQPGDRLWVRETWGLWQRGDATPGGQPYDPHYVYRADDEGYQPDIPAWAQVEPWRWRPSIHMTRKSSRINLEVTNVRVERLQDITPDDASAEGIWEFSEKLRDETCKWRDCASALQRIRVEAFRELWEAVNGAESWKANPFVWVVEFRRTA